MTKDEIRALAFVAFLIGLSALVRVLGAPEPVAVAAEPADLGGLEAASREAVEEEAQRRLPLGAEERLDPNRAPAATLDRLPGIGAATADRIVAARDSAPFGAPEDLLRVRGIGPATLEKIRSHLDLGPVGARRPPPRRTVRSVDRPRVPDADSAGASGTVDVNRADADALQTLSGIGPALAARIVAHRDTAGPFRTPDDLLAVRGIGPPTLARVRARIRIR